MTISQLQSSPIALDPDEWVDAYGDLLYRYAFSRLGDANSAEEVVQETFLAGIRHQATFSGDGSQGAWLMGILKRKILDYLRLCARHQQPPKDDGFDLNNILFDEHGRWKSGILPSISPDEQLESLELWRLVRTCLSKLPQGQAAAFVLSVMEEMESEEICKELDITPSNLWVRLHRARLGLAKCVGDKWFDRRESQSRG